MTAAVRVADVLAGKAAVGSRVTVQGWVRTRRDSKAGLSFVQVHDGSSLASLQIVAKNELPNYEAEIQHLTAGCAITVSGTLAESQGKGQSVELQAESLTVVGWVDDPDSYPVAAKRHTFEYLREVPHLRVRTNTFAAVFRLRSHLSQGIHDFFRRKGFHYVHTPLITTSDCEGAGEMFRVTTLPDDKASRETEDFFGKRAYLTVSGQLEGETFACALSNIYTFGPTFRAENSNTARHAAEFWMIEPEMAFCDLQGDMDLAEEFVKAMARDALEHCAEDLAFFAFPQNDGVPRQLHAVPALVAVHGKVAATDRRHLAVTQFGH